MANKGSYVEIYVRGTEKQLGEFRQALELEAPERSAILKTDVRDCEDRPFSRFDIIESEKETGRYFCLAGHRHLPEMQGGAVRPAEPPLYASVYQLYGLRAAADDSGLHALRQGAHQHGRVSHVPGL